MLGITIMQGHDGHVHCKSPQGPEQKTSQVNMHTQAETGHMHTAVIFFACMQLSSCTITLELLLRPMVTQTCQRDTACVGCDSSRPTDMCSTKEVLSV